MVVGSWLRGQRRFWDVGSKVFVAVADGEFFDHVNGVKQIKPPSRHGEQQFRCSRTGNGHACRTVRSIVWCRLTTFKSPAHPLNSNLKFVVREGAPEQILNQLFWNNVRFSGSNR